MLREVLPVWQSNFRETKEKNNQNKEIKVKYKEQTKLNVSASSINTVTQQHRGRTIDGLWDVGVLDLNQETQYQLALSST